jgi:hypothetical protein
MARIIGTEGADGVTIINGVDSLGVPDRNPPDGFWFNVTPNNPSITIDGLTGVNRANFNDVDFGGGNDTLVAENMVWIADGDPRVAFGSSAASTTLNMGSGDDSVSLNRSAFVDINMGTGNDTLILELSSGRAVNMGEGNDYVRLGGNPGETVSDAELSQKSALTNPLAINGGFGVDTLNLQGEWTLTLNANMTLDMNNDGTPDTTVNTLTYDQVRFVVGWPPNVTGTVDFGTSTLSNGNTIANVATFSNFELINAVCFTAGTMIETAAGTVAIETLREGDMVMTRNGLQPLRWIGKRRLDAIDLAGNPKMLPVRVPAGAFGNGLPTRDVSFSPQHRVVIRSAIAERMFGSAEVLVSIKQMIGVNGIDVDGEARKVEYFHLMFEDHQILQVEGIEAESLYPGPQAISFLSQDQLAELRAIFPNFDELCETDLAVASALPFLKGRESRSLAARHAKNNRPLYA